MRIAEKQTKTLVTIAFEQQGIADTFGFGNAWFRPVYMDIVRHPSGEVEWTMRAVRMIKDGAVPGATFRDFGHRQMEALAVRSAKTRSVFAQLDAMARNESLLP